MSIRTLILLLITLLTIAITGKDLYLLGMLPVVLLGWIAFELLGSFRHKITFDPRLFGLVVVMCGWWLLSIVWSVSPSPSLVTIYLPVSFISGYLLTTLWAVRSPEFYRHLYLPIVIAIAISAIYTIYQLVVGDQPNSFMANKNNHAALLNMGIFFIYAQVLRQGENKKGSIFFAAALFVACTAMFVVGSRGAMVAFVVALLLVMILLHRDLNREGWFYLVVVPVLAFITASVLGDSYVIERTATLANIGDGTGLSSRFNIWRDAMALVWQRPVIGSGIGTFWMLFPMVRDPVQTHFYFFAHNDYLQMWIELGLIGLLLFLAVLFYLAVKTIYLLRNRNLSRESYLEVVAISAGVSSMLIHSLVTFNLNIPIFLLLLGIVIARLQMIDIEVAKLQGKICFSVIPQQFISRGGYSLFTVLLLMLSVNFSASFFASAVLQNMAKDEIFNGDIESGSKKLSYSRTLSPNVDIFHMERANILRSALHRYWEEKTFNSSVAGYRSCLELNRYRVECYFGLADLFAIHPEKSRYLPQVEPLYLEALKYDPASPLILGSYARFYIKQGNLQKAYEILDGTENYIMVRRTGEQLYLLTYIWLLKSLGMDGDIAPLQERLNL